MRSGGVCKIAVRGDFCDAANANPNANPRIRLQGAPVKFGFRVDEGSYKGSVLNLTRDYLNVNVYRPSLNLFISFRKEPLTLSWPARSYLYCSKHCCTVWH